MSKNTKLPNSLKHEIKANVMNATGQEYKPIKLLGGGSSSIAVLLENPNGEQLVYKCDRKLTSFLSRLKLKLHDIQLSTNTSLSAIQAEIEVITNKFILEDNYIKRLQDKCRSSKCPIFIPKFDRFPRFILEEYAGSTLTPSDLVGEKSDKFAQDLAHFYLSLHAGKKQHPRSEPLMVQMCHNLPEIFRKYQYSIDSTVLNLVKNAYKALISMDSSDEYITTIHGDFRRQNLCYNPNTKRLAVIDWEFARQDNIYLEFVTQSVSSQQLPFSFISKVIDEYNLHSDVKINKEKLKNLLILGIFNDYGSYGLKNNFSHDEFLEVCNPQLKSSLLMLFNDSEYIKDECEK